MRVESIAVRLRPRTAYEAADLGARLCQRHAADVYRTLAVAYVPIVVLTVTSFEFAVWMPAVVLWCSKPWLDRTILFVLARAAFGQRTGVADLWRATRSVWGGQLAFTWVVQRLSPWRSLTQPVYQLEGLTFRRARRRAAQISHRTILPALATTLAFWIAELALCLALLSLLVWFKLAGSPIDIRGLFLDSGPWWLRAAFDLGYGITLFLLEPFYVGAGFAMYLNRRVELEAWDIEQEFRRAFAG